MIVTPVFLKKEKKITKQNNTTAFKLKNKVNKPSGFFLCKENFRFLKKCKPNLNMSSDVIRNSKHH